MKRIFHLLALGVLGTLLTGKSQAVTGVISTLLNPPGPVNLNDTFVVTLSISGYTDPIEIDAYQFEVTYPAALFSFAGSIDHGTTGAGLTQQWLAKPNQETELAGYSPDVNTTGSVAGVVLVDLADTGFSDPEGGTVAATGFLVSFMLRADAAGTGSITPRPPPGGEVLFRSDPILGLVPTGTTPTFSGASMTAIPEPGTFSLASIALFAMGSRRRRRREPVES